MGEAILQEEKPHEWVMLLAMFERTEQLEYVTISLSASGNEREGKYDTSGTCTHLRANTIPDTHYNVVEEIVHLSRPT
jgi:hypothetical protein